MRRPEARGSGWRTAAEREGSRKGPRLRDTNKRPSPLWLPSPPYLVITLTCKARAQEPTPSRVGGHELDNTHTSSGARRSFADPIGRSQREPIEPTPPNNLRHADPDRLPNSIEVPSHVSLPAGRPPLQRERQHRPMETKRFRTTECYTRGRGSHSWVGMGFGVRA